MPSISAMPSASSPLMQAAPINHCAAAIRPTPADLQRLGQRVELSPQLLGQHYQAFAKTTPRQGTLFNHLIASWDERTQHAASPLHIPGAPAVATTSRLQRATWVSTAHLPSRPLASTHAHTALSMPNIAAQFRAPSAQGTPLYSPQVSVSPSPSLVSLSPSSHSNATELTSLEQALKRLARSQPDQGAALNTLLSGLDAHVQSVEKGFKALGGTGTPGAARLTTALPKAVDPLSDGQARRVLTLLDGGLGQSARAVGHYASAKQHQDVQAHREALTRLTHTASLLEGLGHALSKKLKVAAPRFAAITPTILHKPQLSLQERMALAVRLKA